MNDIVAKDRIKIEDMIYEIRGKQVMLDFDLARIYECKNGTKTVNQAVNRHLERFPSDFYFRLTDDEYINLQSQFGTANLSSMKRHNPYAFTEQGIAMLATVLRTKVAAEMSISIMRAFVKMRHYISSNLLEQKYINNMVLENNERINKNTKDIKLLQASFDKMEKERKVNEVYFNGKVYDAYSKVLDIFSEAKNELIIVDRYTDKTVLDMIKNLECNVKIITCNRSKLTRLDIDKYNKDYHNLSVYYDDTFHDRYFVIDRSIVYHSGNSINHIGFRKSSIDAMNDKNVIRAVIKDWFSL